jgi:hypothetical protein
MQPRSRTELSLFYGYACTRTFTRLLTSEGIKIRRRKLISPNDQLKIYAHLGIPPLLDKEEQANILRLLEEYCEKNGFPPP